MIETEAFAKGVENSLQWLYYLQTKGNDYFYWHILSKLEYINIICLFLRLSSSTD